MRQTLVTMMGILLMLGLSGLAWGEGTPEQLQALKEKRKRTQDLNRLMEAAWECETLAKIGQRMPLEDTDRLFRLGHRAGRAYYAHAHNMTDAKHENDGCIPEPGVMTVEFRLGVIHQGMWGRMNGFVSWELEKFSGTKTSLAEEERSIALRLFHSRNCALLATGSVP